MKPLLLLFSLIALCANQAIAAPRILATIKPIHALVSGVTEGVTTPELLLEKNASPHSYSLRPNDISKIEQADIIVQVGPEFELFLDKVLQNSKATIVPLTHLAGLTTWPIRHSHIWEDEDEDEDEHEEHHHHTGAIDPHIWLDPNNAIIIVNHIAAILTEKDPEHAAHYQQNANHMVEAIKQLDTSLAEQLAPYRTTPYLVSHDAYHYFEKHYQLTGVGAITLTPDKTPGAKTLARLQQIANDRGAVCLFSEPQFPENFIHLIADKTQIGTGILDAEWGARDNDTGKEAYFHLIQGLANNMVTCFNQQARKDLSFIPLHKDTAPLPFTTLASQAKKTVFLFWRTDCAPCLQEMSLLPELAATHTTMDIVAIVLQEKQQAERYKLPATPANVRLFAIANAGSIEQTQQILRAFGSTIPALPFSALVTDEKICATHNGQLSMNLLDIWEKTC